MPKTTRSPRTLWFVAIALVWYGQLLASAQNCALEECANANYAKNNTCYKTKGVKWCKAAGQGITLVNVYNHTRYPQVATSWANWNHPLNFGSDRVPNTLWLRTDGVNNSNHDIDYWEINEPNSQWFGEFINVGGSSGGCYNPGSGRVNLNSAKLGGLNGTPINANRALSTAEHETGHGIGLGHVCRCPHIMDPCVNCGTALSVCDSQGAHALYP